MRAFFFLILVFLLLDATDARAQYTRPDAVALATDAPTPDGLAHLLTKDFTEDRDKVRAIFRWVTANIRYRLRSTESRRAARATVDPDTAWDGRPADERTAYLLLKRREAVCEGYARLFNALCRYAGVRSQQVRGYVRNDSDPVNRTFASNHSWNAVWFDSSWHLVDATWAAGYVRNGSNEFTPSLDEFYYLTPPAEFARNHFPEDLNWGLLAQLPALPELRYGPFRTIAALKYRVLSQSPGTGILRVAAGDTLRLRVELSDTLKPGAYLPQLPGEQLPDSVLRGAVPADPLTALPARVLHYEYVVRPGDEWLQLRCNGENILYYKLEGGARGLPAGGKE